MSRMVPLLVLASLLAHHASARADATEAKVHYERGTNLYALARYAEAAVEYEKAYEAKADPALLYNAAQAHRMAGQKQRALSLYQSYLRLYGVRVQNREEVERHVQKLKQAIEGDTAAATSPPTGTSAPTAARPAPAVEQPAPSAAVVSRTPEKPARPLVKQPWFWGVIAGSAALVGLGIGLGIGLGAQSDPTPTLGSATWR
jgi:hypothetical protein